MSSRGAIGCVIIFCFSGATSIADDTALPITDAHYKDACGPIACYVALRAIGETPSLEQLSSMLEWQPGRKTKICQVLTLLDQWPGLRCDGLNLSIDELWDFAGTKNLVLLLPVKRNSSQVNHLVTAVSLIDDRLAVVDYPDLKAYYSRHSLLEEWDGAALVLSRQRMLPYLWLTESAQVRGLIIFCLGGMGIIATIMMCWRKLCSTRRTNDSSG